MTITQQRTMSSGPVTFTGPLDALSRVLRLDVTDSFADVVDALVLSRFVDGSQPWARTRRLDRIRDDATLLPPGVVPVRVAVGDGRDARLATGDGWTLLAVRYKTGGGLVGVTAVSDELAGSILDLATDGAVDRPEPDDERVEIGFWYDSPRGARRSAMPIEAARWAEIRGNYAAAAAAAFDRLVATDAEHLGGRIVLVHGEPGTGKTTALRALAREWRAWCQVDFVIDPDRLFAQPGYLIEAVLGYARERDENTWRMLLLEDCDELIRSDAKRATGQALSRLLNLTDGLLGQGRRILVAITTNEDVARLHPAVTRPGRCLAQVAMGRLSYAEATAWLGRGDGIDASGATLARLYALRDDATAVSADAPAPAGFYL